MFEARGLLDQTKILSAGGGFKVNAATIQTLDLQKLAAAASNGKARLVLSGLGTRSTEDLMKIAAAGKGYVFFDD